MPDFLPRPEGELLRWSASFDQRINSSGGEYGCRRTADEFHAALEAFAAWYQLAAAVHADAVQPDREGRGEGGGGPAGPRRRGRAGRGMSAQRVALGVRCGPGRHRGSGRRHGAAAAGGARGPSECRARAAARRGVAVADGQAAGRARATLSRAGEQPPDAHRGGCSAGTCRGRRPSSFSRTPCRPAHGCGCRPTGQPRRPARPRRDARRDPRHRRVGDGGVRGAV